MSKNTYRSMGGVNYYPSSSFTTTRYTTAKPLFDASGKVHRPYVKFRKLSRNAVRFLALLADRRKDNRDRCFAVETDTAVLLANASPQDFHKIAEAYNYLWIRHTHDYANNYREVADFFRSKHSAYLRGEYKD